MVASVQLPIELINLLNEINHNINEVKVEVAALKAQDHTQTIENLRVEVAKEREKWFATQLEITILKTRLAPLWGAGVFLVTTLATLGIDNWLIK